MHIWFQSPEMNRDIFRFRLNRYPFPVFCRIAHPNIIKPIQISGIHRLPGDMVIQKDVIQSFHRLVVTFCRADVKQSFHLASLCPHSPRKCLFRHEPFHTAFAQFQINRSPIDFPFLLYAHGPVFLQIHSIHRIQRPIGRIIHIPFYNGHNRFISVIYNPDFIPHPPFQFFIFLFGTPYNLAQPFQKHFFCKFPLIQIFDFPQAFLYIPFKIKRIIQNR